MRPNERRRGSGSSVVGCLGSAILLFVEFSVGVSIAAIVAEAVAPALAARGYNVRVGGGFLFAAALGIAAAVYPVIWLDRLRRRLTRR